MGREELLSGLEMRKTYSGHEELQSGKSGKILKIIINLKGQA
jgi:hypothetical protein